VNGMALPEQYVNQNKQTPLILLHQLEVSYTLHEETFTVFKEIDLIIQQGEFVSIVGPSGCGKTTLLKVIAGLQLSTSGKVHFREKEVTKPPENMIYVFQQYSKSIFPWRTVWQNLIYGIENKLDKKTIEAKGKKYLELVGLKGKERLYPAQLSGGMQQRLAIARALICEPRVLLMDEPFSAIDALTRMKLQQLLLDIWSETKITIIFVTHDVEEAVYMSSRVISLSKSPAHIDKDIVINLEYPRNQLKTKENPKFIGYRHEFLESIFQAEGMR
jgi:NitT/TauT family transport system ATP-binding protein